VASRPNFWPRPRPQRFSLGLGLDLKHLPSAWPRSRCLVMQSGIFSGKTHVKFGNSVNFQAITLKLMLLIIIWYFFHNYFWPRPWPQPPEIGLGLGLVALASASASSSASRFWLRLTSLSKIDGTYFSRELLFGATESTTTK